jgi:hypothetical protein
MALPKPLFIWTALFAEYSDFLALRTGREWTQLTLRHQTLPRRSSLALAAGMIRAMTPPEVPPFNAVGEPSGPTER